MRQRPYELPQKLICDADAEINYDLVTEYIAKHEKGMKRYVYLENLYQGFHDIYNQVVKDAWKPDNRLAVNFPRYITETFLGYAYGIPIKKSHVDDAFLAVLEEFNSLNDAPDHEYELAKMACIFGHTYELVYQNEEKETRLSALSPMNCFIVFDDTVKGSALFAVRYGYKGDGDTLVGEVFTSTEVFEIQDKMLLEVGQNPYGRLPIVEYVLNRERMGIFEEIAGLVETYNKAVGEKANDIDAFAEAYLAIIGAEVDEEGIQRIRDDRIISFYETNSAKEVLVQFLTKPTADGSQENLLNRLETLIYQISMVANISDESYGSASGTALAYKLHAMSNLALTFDRKMQSSLRRRYRLFCSLPTNTPSKDAYKDIEYTFTRNIPKNLLEESQVAQNLEGIVSQETQLSVLSIVSDVAKEIERIEDAEKDAQNDAVSRRMFQPQEGEIDDKP
jgi:phage portal protein, SPP1 family